MTTSIMIVGAGKGERFGQPKLFVQLAGKSLLQWNLDVLQELDFDPQVVVVAHPEHVTEVVQQVPEGVKVVSGGAERNDSVRNGLEACSGELVMIHNVANPLVSPQDYHRLYELLTAEDCAAFVGQPVVDTLRRLKDQHVETVDRTHMWRVQTPQGFRTQTLMDQLDAPLKTKRTDEVMLFEGSEVPIKAVTTSPFNQKITFPEDLEMLEQVIGHEVLVGIGEDSHYFDTSGEMMLGGIKVADLPKLHGNSDGDLILHAIFNAMSSALGQRSIGPTADPMAEQGIVDSTEYIRVIMDRVQERGYCPQNLSISLECKKPKIEPIVDDMKERLSELLGIDPQHIGITATTGEGLSTYGKGEGIKCTCVVSLIKV